MPSSARLQELPNSYHFGHAYRLPLCGRVDEGIDPYKAYRTFVQICTVSVVRTGSGGRPYYPVTSNTLCLTQSFQIRASL